MAELLEHIYLLIIGIGGWMFNRVVKKIDDLERNKSTNISLGRIGDHCKALDKKVDELAHTALSRVEIQRANEKLHERINFVERVKQDKVAQNKNFHEQNETR
jgi:hypothetical protein|tara:strand:- start:943 stop:1251 length:309 start_codon:yes stop_codon:yes gene_type:complete